MDRLEAGNTLGPYHGRGCTATGATARNPRLGIAPSLQQQRRPILRPLTLMGLLARPGSPCTSRLVARPSRGRREALEGRLPCTIGRGGSVSWRGSLCRATGRQTRSSGEIPAPLDTAINTSSNTFSPQVLRDRALPALRSHIDSHDGPETDSTRFYASADLSPHADDTVKT
jgi:hypothetical protein